MPTHLLLLLAATTHTVTSTSLCDTKSYQRTSLIHLASTKLGAVFPDASGMKQFEASGVAVCPDGRAAIIYDNAHTIGLIDAGTLIPFAPRGVTLGQRRANQSQHEGVAWRTDGGGPPTVLALVEAAVDPSDGETKARIDEYRVPAARSLLRLGAPPNPSIQKCWIQGLTFSHDNKGLEDLVYLGAGRALALCEGNRCSGGARGRDPGHGRLVVLTYTPAGGAPCAWTVDKLLALPSDAYFTDYAGLALRRAGNGDGASILAVLSQTDAALWVGRFNASSLEFEPHDDDTNRLFSLPRDALCRPTLCNAEGIDFLDDPSIRGPARVVVTTDKARPGAPWACVRGSESVYVLGLPRGAVEQVVPWGVV